MQIFVLYLIYEVQSTSIHVCLMFRYLRARTSLDFALRRCIAIFSLVFEPLQTIPISFCKEVYMLCILSKTFES